MLKVFIFCFAITCLSCGGNGHAGFNRKSENVNKPENSTSSETGSSAAEKVFIRSADGTIIVGSFIKAKKEGSAPAVLLLHQWQANRHTFDDLAERLANLGLSSLSIDGRGFGESTKQENGKSVTAERTSQAVEQMLEDVKASVNFLRTKQGVDPKRVAIIGASYGSSLALLYAANFDQEVKGLILLSPGLNYFGNMDTTAAIKKYGDRPILMFAAEDDPESANAVRRLKELSGGKADSEIFSSGGHGTYLLSNQESVKKIENFLTSALDIQ
ncbi:MAG TPA: alpha/beta fold hydrolase [Pyrinomonadaceae bacterium]|nr:alpha/beta fold hydrolase [Pyrinomonadaceae bacterium]